MNGRQLDKLSMKIVTNDKLSKTSQNILNKMPHIQGLITQFSTNINTIRQYNSQQTLNRTGIRKKKEKLREEMTILAFETAAQIGAYALSINNKCK